MSNWPKNRNGCIWNIFEMQWVWRSLSNEFPTTSLGVSMLIKNPQAWYLVVSICKTLANKVNYWICLVAFTWHTRISVRALGSSDEAKSQHPESLQPWMTVCEVYRTCSCLLWRGNVFQRICQCIQAGVIMTRLLFYSQYDCSLQ